jgi:hypothetical protein
MFTGPQHTLTRRRNLYLRQIMPTEVETCRPLAVLKLQAAGWDNEPHFIPPQPGFPQRLTLSTGSHTVQEIGAGIVDVIKGE